MKQKAKIYKGRRIVIGDKNLITKNEIHVNDIPQEGGESGGGDIDNWSYYDVSNIPSKLILVELALLPILVKIKTNDKVAICSLSTCFVNVPTEDIESKVNEVHSIAFPLNCKVMIEQTMFENGIILTEEFLDNQMGLASLKITKEEFYTI